MLHKNYTGRKTLLHVRLCKAVLPAVFCIALLISNTLHAQRNDAYAYEVFETLLHAINRNVPSKPVLIVENSSRLIAETTADGQVKVGYQLIDHFRSFGADSSAALAHILSHELMHYYNNHLWGAVVGSSYADEQWGAELSRIGADTITRQLNETQADIYAMYYAFNAGYPTYRLASRVIDSTYFWYNKKEKLEGYPTKTARKKIAEDAANEIVSLIPLFESSALLIHISGMYSGEEMLSYIQIASASISAILNKNIQTKEMFNNLAIAQIMEALAFLGNDTLMQMQWPLITETESMLYNIGGTRGNPGGNENAEKAKQLLAEAIENLDNAVQLDNTFYPAYINKCVALLLLKKFGSCADVADEAAAYIPENKAFLLNEISGFAYLLKGKIELAEEEMLQAEKNGSRTAIKNIAVYTDPSKITPSYIITGTDTTTTFDQMYIGAYMDKQSASRIHRFDLNAGFAIVFYDTVPSGMLYDIRPKPGTSPFRYMRLLSVTDSKTKTAKNTGCGSAEKDITQAYGQPYAVRYESDGKVLMYPAQNLLFRIQNDRVIEWCHWWAK